MKRFISVLVLAIVPCTVRGDDGPAIDPKAKDVLTRVGAAYKDLRTLDQETTYGGEGLGSDRLVKTRLVIQRPNRLLLEVTEREAGFAEPMARRYQCDGKDLYTYSQVQGYFTMNKAPKDFAGFREFAANVELAAIAGLDPFGQLVKQARAVRQEEPGLVNATPVDVVFVDMGNEERTGELRLYTGHDDHLLYRLSYISKPITKPTPPKPAPKEAASPLDPDELPMEPPTPLPPVRFEYENHVLANKDLPKDIFRWIAPPGVMRLNQDPTAFRVQRGAKQPGFAKIATPMDLSDPTPVSDIPKPTKKVFASDLIKKAQKQKKP